jgi:quinol monooxygenase YgiN
MSVPPPTPETSANAPQLARDHRSGSGCDARLDITHRLRRDYREYLAGCARIVEHARRAVGCLDVSICAGLVDPGRVNIFERWESQAMLETFRSAPLIRNSTGDAHGVRSGVRHRDVRPVFGKEAE